MSCKNNRSVVLKDIDIVRCIHSYFDEYFLNLKQELIENIILWFNKNNKMVLLSNDNEEKTFSYQLVNSNLYYNKDSYTYVYDFTNEYCNNRNVDFSLKLEDFFSSKKNNIFNKANYITYKDNLKKFCENENQLFYEFLFNKCENKFNKNFNLNNFLSLFNFPKFLDEDELIGAKISIFNQFQASIQSELNNITKLPIDSIVINNNYKTKKELGLICDELLNKELSIFIEDLEFGSIDTRFHIFSSEDDFLFSIDITPFEETIFGYQPFHKTYFFSILNEYSKKNNEVIFILEDLNTNNSKSFSFLNGNIFENDTPINIDEIDNFLSIKLNSIKQDI